MPLAKLVLLLVIVIAAAGLTVAFGAMLVGSMNVSSPMALALLLPVAVTAYVVFRVVSERLANTEDNKYDQIPR